MATIALISEGKVTNVLVADDGWESAFPEAVAAPDGVKVGYTYDGAAFAAPTPAVLPEPDLISYASRKRYEVETGGVAVFGFIVKTGREDRTLIYEAEASAKADAAFTTIWIAADGTSHDLGAEMVLALAAAVRAHVAACFATYSVVAAAISAGTITTTADVDGAAWPANR